MKLEGVHIFQAETIRRAAKIPTELRYRVEVRLLRRRRQITDRHVLDHAAAKRADLSNRKTSCLKGWGSKKINHIRPEVINANAPLMTRRRLRSIPRESATQRIGITCRTFAANAVRLQLYALAYKLGRPNRQPRGCGDSKKRSNSFDGASS